MTAMAYFLNYEALHLLYHLPEESAAGRLALVRRLRRLHQTVVLQDTPEIRGMINKVNHMVTVEE